MINKFYHLNKIKAVYHVFAIKYDISYGLL